MNSLEKFKTLPFELRKLGLNKKEADVYLFLLEKEYSTVLEISQNLSLSRPTVYRTLQVLITKELVFNNSDRKKSHFCANSPEAFLKVIRVKRRKVEEQEREFLRIISTLQTKYRLSEKKNEIKFYQKKTLLEEFSNNEEKNICVFCSDPNFIDYKKISKCYPSLRKKLGQIFIKEIHANKSPVSNFDFVKMKILDIDNQPWLGTLIITDKVFILDKKQTLCIEEESTVEIIKLFFNLLWQAK